ncbi:GCN5 family acetyltransferase [Thermoanaerobacter sp. YS13]|uniref:GNAT family N-acetyltransferase n=1 Tax=Thermoanaerobacter sp. YS13 TaxID=1511746 RepID=UPI000573E63E|nr:GNAT family protein [Thermoanaerobacter sp. YS13]KHO62627.1 GCN5 family acetyltransferase [Thermoanaerobacter sp. YS13]
MLKSNRIELVPFESKYFEKFVEFRNSDDSRNLTMPGIPYPVTVETVAERWKTKKDPKENGEFAIILRSTGEYIGNVSYNNVDWKNRNCEIAIMIGEEKHRNKGYGTEALNLLLDFIFNELNLHRVELRVYDFNERAIKSYEKCGFKKEGLLREVVYKHGKYINEYVMGILKEEFINRNNYYQGNNNNNK